jgi:hypothetical protein
LAIALKPFPAIFLAILFRDKRYKNICLVMAFSLIISVFSLFSVTNGNMLTSIQQASQGLKYYGRDYVIGNEGLYFGSSLFGAVKILITLLSANELYNYYYMIGRFLGLYYWMASALLIIVTLYIMFIEKEFWKRICLLVFCIILLPLVSADYKLLYLYIPFFLFLNSKQKDKYDTIYTVLFSLLFIPKNYLNFEFPSLILHSEANLGIILNPVLMLVICYFIFKSRWDILIRNLLG